MELMPKSDEIPFKLPIDIQKIGGVYGYVNYTSFTLKGKLNLISPQQEGNHDVVTLLNGLKALASLKQDALAGLMNGIILTSDENNITVTFNIPDELIRELEQELKTKAAEWMGIHEEEYRVPAETDGGKQ